MWNSIGATPERWTYCKCSWRGWVVPCSNQHIYSSLCCLLHLTDRQLRKTALIQAQGHLSPWFCEIQIPHTQISSCCKWQGVQVTVAVQGRNISHPSGKHRHISMLELPLCLVLLKVYFLALLIKWRLFQAPLIWSEFMPIQDVKLQKACLFFSLFSQLV